MKPEDYFKRFQNLRPEEEKKLEVRVDQDTILRILWVDNDMVSPTALGRSMKRTLRVMGVIPAYIGINYAWQGQQAVDMAEDPIHKMIILDNDMNERGVAIGANTLMQIRDLMPDIPIVYTTSMPDQLSNYVKEKVQEVVRTTDIPVKLPELILKYVRKAKP